MGYSEKVCVNPPYGPRKKCSVQEIESLKEKYKDILRSFDYDNVCNMSFEQRNLALDQALNELGAWELIGLLLSLYVMHRKMDPDLAEIFFEDAEYVRETYTRESRKDLDYDLVFELDDSIPCQ